MRVYPDSPDGKPFDTDDAAAMHAWWDTLGESWVRVNIVTDRHGRTADAAHTSEGLTGGADRALLTALRRSADVVVLGAATVRSEPLSVPRITPLVVVSRCGEIPVDALSRATIRPIVLSPTHSEHISGADVLPLHRFTAESIVTVIRSLGYSRIVCEGGATLAGLFCDPNVTTELCQTISPVDGSPDAPRFASPEWNIYNTAHDDAGFRYLRSRPVGAP